MCEKLLALLLPLFAHIDERPCFPRHFSGILISGEARIGRNVVIHQDVSIGSNRLTGGKRRGTPAIGDHVCIGTGACIIGRITVDDNCRIGTNALVFEDLPPNSVAVQQPTRVTPRGGRRVYCDDGRWVEAGELGAGGQDTGNH